MQLDPVPSKDKVAYAAWRARHTHCQACGISATKAERERWPGLSAHHYIKQHRALESCVQLMLCSWCHCAAEGQTVRVNGVPWPRLTIGVCRTLKAVREPEEVDWARCRQLRGSALPDFEAVPETIEQAYRAARPRDKRRFFYGMLPTDE